MFISTSFYWYISPFVTKMTHNIGENKIPVCLAVRRQAWLPTRIQTRPGQAVLSGGVDTGFLVGWGHLWWEPGCHSHTLMIRPRVPLPGIPAEKGPGGRRRARAARITGEPAAALQTASVASFRACPGLPVSSTFQEPLREQWETVLSLPYFTSDPELSW